jgi:hypothetical protein
VSVYSLAAATLAVFGILYPVVTFLTLWGISRRSRGVACGEFSKEHDSRIWEELVEDEFTRDKWCVWPFCHLRFGFEFAFAFAVPLVCGLADPLVLSRPCPCP